MSWVRVWIHLVFSTKNREPFLNSTEIREKVFNHIKKSAKEKDIWLEALNGYKEHIHCLVSLNKEHSISKVAQLLKGESSFWINKNKLIKDKFIWQDDYWAASVSESHIESVKKYIAEQEDHHRIKSFSKEVDEFMKKYGWRYINNESDK